MDPKNRPEKHVQALITMYPNAQPKLVTTMWRVPIKNNMEANYENVRTELQKAWKREFRNNEIVDYKIESSETVWKIVEEALQV